jgi:hypothetical protein
MKGGLLKGFSIDGTSGGLPVAELYISIAEIRQMR